MLIHYLNGFHGNWITSNAFFLGIQIFTNTPLELRHIHVKTDNKYNLQWLAARIIRLKLRHSKLKLWVCTWTKTNKILQK
jgi:hypothetical protein